MKKHSFIYVGENTHVVELTVKDHLGTPQNDATAELVSIVDASGDPVADVSVPIALTYDAGTAMYRAELPHGGAFVAGQMYKAKVRAVGAQGFRGEWIETLPARERVA